MVKRYSIAEARSHLPNIVDQVQAGHEIVLTRRGEAVAVVLSIRELARHRGHLVPFGDAYQRFLINHNLHEVGVDDEVFVGVRNAAVERKLTL